MGARFFNGRNEKICVLWLMASFVLGVRIINNGCLKYQRVRWFLNIETENSPTNAVCGTSEAGQLGFIVFCDLTDPKTSGQWRLFLERPRGY